MITALLLVTTPSPTGSATPEVDSDLVTPGVWGFLLLFFLALAVYFLGRSMARRVQRMNHRAQAEAEAEEQEAAAALRSGLAGTGSEGEPPAGR